MDPLKAIGLSIAFAVWTGAVEVLTENLTSERASFAEVIDSGFRCGS
jgi:hypothetical protein